jgi:amino acid transporter
VLNGLTVKYFGISEFYMSIFKIFLMLGLMMYTFVTMVGGNPDRDPYGFRYWRDPVRRVAPYKLGSNSDGKLTE